MSSKPIDTGRWAQTAGGTPATNLTAISTGQADTGWTLGQKPPSGIANTLGTIAYLWHKWLDDGDCAFHNLSATGTLAVTGVSTFGDKLTVSANGADINGNTHVIAGTFTTDAGKAVSVGGTLGVTGLSTFSGGIVVPTGQDVNLQGSTTLEVGGAATLTGGIANNVTLSGGVTVPTGQTVALNGTTTLTVGSGATVLGGTLAVTGQVNFPDPECYSIGFAIITAGAILAPGTNGSSPSLSLSTTTLHNNLPLKMRGGTTLSSWSINLVKNSATGTITAKLWKVINGATTPTQIGATQTNSGVSPGSIALGQAGLTEAVLASNSYFIELLGGGTNGDLVFDYRTTVA